MDHLNQNISYQRTEMRRGLQASARLNAMERRLRKAETLDCDDQTALIRCVISERSRCAQLVGGPPIFPGWILDRQLDRLFRRGRFALDAA
jgi:hypothetical protein